MTSLLLLIPLSVLFLGLAIAGLFWAVRTEQFEDLESEGRRVLFDDEPLGESKTSVSAEDGAGK